MTTATATQLIPSSNFTVRSLKGKTQQAKIAQGLLTITFTGWGIWDNAAKAWVSLNDFEHGVAVPTSYKKSTAQAAISQGLYNGYSLVSL